MLLDMVPHLILLLMVLHQTLLEEVHIHHPLVLIHPLFMELHPVSYCFILEDTTQWCKDTNFILKWCFMLQNPEISTSLMSKLAYMQTLPCY